MVAEYKSTAVCILGMHRSGTSSVARAMNLLGVYLGEEAKLQQVGSDNPEGFWEHRDILDIQNNLLARLDRSWDTAAPLPAGWQHSTVVRPFREKLMRVVAGDFREHPLWGWKDPRTCLLLPLWRDLLGELNVRLVCLFVARNPVDVANSLIRREPIPFGRALAIWFNYCAAALKDAAGRPIVFLSYDKFLASWEPELRRCATALDLAWPADADRVRAGIQLFLKPDLRHNQSRNDLLQETPEPVQRLHQLLLAACDQPTARHDDLHEAATRLYLDYGAGRLPGELGAFACGRSDIRPSYWERTWRRWQRSFHKRFGAEQEGR